MVKKSYRRQRGQAGCLVIVVILLIIYLFIGGFVAEVMKRQGSSLCWTNGVLTNEFKPSGYVLICFTWPFVLMK